MSKKQFKKALALSFVFLILALMYIPILMLIVYSFTNSKTFSSWNGFSLALYAELFTDSSIQNALSNTLVIAIVSSLIATVIGTFSAIGIHKLKKRAKNFANTLSQITVVNADIVTAVAFMLFFVAFGLRGSGYLTLIIGHTLISIPFVMLLISPRLGQLNENLHDAGLDLGAGQFRTLFTVILPQLVPAMIAGFAMAFTLSLDDFVITKYNNAGMIETLSTYLYNTLTKKGFAGAGVLKSLSSVIFIFSFVILLFVNLHKNKKARKNLY